ncbi:MAG TPA: hypothetical protein VIX86_16790 [Streptosporangiaceae bacterium]
MAVAAAYAAYLVISLGLTVAVGSALSRSGRVVLASVLGDEGLARAVTRLGVVAFYLLSLGFVALTMPSPGQIASPRQAAGVLFSKIGLELLVLGGLHLVNMAFVTRFRRRTQPGPYRPAGPAAPVPPARGDGPGATGTPGPAATPGASAAASWRPVTRQAVH